MWNIAAGLIGQHLESKIFFRVFRVVRGLLFFADQGHSNAVADHERRRKNSPDKPVDSIRINRECICHLKDISNHKGLIERANHLKCDLNSAN
jgi:hypothetical protein